MKIALIGGSGNIGQRILNEALLRGHRVTVIARDPSRITQRHENLSLMMGNVFDSERIAEVISGHEVVISAYGPTERKESFAKATHSLLEVVKQAPGVKRLIVVGGARTLNVAPEVTLLETVFLPKELRESDMAHHEAKDLITEFEDDLDWTIISPAMNISPGTRTGKYRTGSDQLNVDEHGKSEISTEDYAVALLDEVEHHRFSRQRFTVAY
jgi:putative NADH-flavin reductase